MERAADLLGERKTGEATRQAETAARKRFEDLIASLATPQGKGKKQEPANENGGGGGGESGPQVDGIPALAELKMLKTLQQDLNDRTAQVASRHQAGMPLSPEEQRELAAISAEQGELADLALNFMQRAKTGDDEEDEDSDEAPRDRRSRKQTDERPADKKALQLEE
jgi:hypothetical protein